MSPAFSRHALLKLFQGYDKPTVNIAAMAETADFVTPAKVAGQPPFAHMLYAAARASLEVEAFRWRVVDGQPVRIDALQVSYTVVGADGNLNFSTIPYDPDFQVFLDHYLADRELARVATHLRLEPRSDAAYLHCTCLPWLRFTQLEHPIADARDNSIPAIALGKFHVSGGQVDFPIAVQAHHGLVDGLHIAQLIGRVVEILNDPATR